MDEWTRDKQLPNSYQASGMEGSSLVSAKPEEKGFDLCRSFNRA